MNASCDKILKMQDYLNSIKAIEEEKKAAYLRMDELLISFANRLSLISFDVNNKELIALKDNISAQKEEIFQINKEERKRAKLEDEDREGLLKLESLKSDYINISAKSDENMYNLAIHLLNRYKKGKLKEENISSNIDIILKNEEQLLQIDNKNKLSKILFKRKQKELNEEQGNLLNDWAKEQIKNFPNFQSNEKLYKDELASLLKRIKKEEENVLERELKQRALLKPFSQEHKNMLNTNLENTYLNYGKKLYEMADQNEYIDDKAISILKRIRVVDSKINKLDEKITLIKFMQNKEKAKIIIDQKKAQILMLLEQKQEISDTIKTLKTEVTKLEKQFFN